MVQPKMSVLGQKSQVPRNRPQGTDDDLRRGHADRRRPGRPDKVHPSLVPLLRGEAVPYRLLSDELDPPYGLEHTTPRFPLAVNLIVAMPLLGVLGLVAWAMRRWDRQGSAAGSARIGASDEHDAR